MIYTKEVESCISRILCSLNREECSGSLGSFDRYYWAWKKRDFQDSTLSYAVIPLIKGLRRIGSNIDINEILEIAVYNILRIQKKDGSFDQCYPNEKHPKNGLDISSVLYEALKRNPNVECERAYRLLLDSSLNDEEDYADICNHLAHHAYEYLQGYLYFNDSRYYHAAIRNINVISELTHPSEGWHREYLGADPGYQTRTLRYLTKCLNLLKEEDRERCDVLCKLSAKFIDATVMPDGTLYAAFGSRNTAIIYPSGIEYVSARYSQEYSCLASRVREGIANGLAIKPMYLEFDNFIRLFDDYLDAQFIKDQFHVNSDDDENARINDYALGDYGMDVIKKGSSRIYVHNKYGGACAVYDNNNCIYRDAGLLVKDNKGKYYGSRNLHLKSNIELSDNERIVISSSMFRSIHKDISPFELLILRILNLTILRIKYFADIFRNYLVSNVIVGNRRRPRGILTRDIQIIQEKLEIRDRLRLNVIPLKIWRAVNLNLFHMASSRYANPVESIFRQYEELKHNGNSEVVFRTTISLGQ